MISGDLRTAMHVAASVIGSHSTAERQVHLVARGRKRRSDGPVLELRRRHDEQRQHLDDRGHDDWRNRHHDRRRHDDRQHHDRRQRRSLSSRPPCASAG
jgi:hypothetical protein